MNDLTTAISEYNNNNPILSEAYSEAKNTFRNCCLDVLHEHINTYLITNEEPVKFEGIDDKEMSLYTIIDKENKQYQLLCEKNSMDILSLHEQDDNSCHKYEKIDSENGTIIDLGCTDGLFEILCCNRNNYILGIDSDEAHKEIFFKNLELNGFDVTKCYFGSIFCNEQLYIEDSFDDKPIICIKMDIEGFELETLYALKSLILKYKPMLQVCAYHKPHHFKQLMDYIINVLNYTDFTLRKGFVVFEDKLSDDIISDELLRTGLIIAKK